MTPRIETIPAFTVVGLQILATPMDPAIPQLWPKFDARSGEIDMRTEPNTFYGVMEDVDPATMRFNYLAGVAVWPDAGARALPAGMTHIDIPAAEYVVFSTTLATIGKAYSQIFSQWLPTSGRKQAPTAYFERYGPAFSVADPASTFDICVPLLP